MAPKAKKETLMLYKKGDRNVQAMKERNEREAEAERRFQMDKKLFEEGMRKR